ncbi:hypothetical protein C8F04DRAFT_1075572 [Mycena alexandri]|uniref:Enoyl reductase (ER) domain-containing protein n=1 Tax=Mycena alexandri TaxID=1745969 RepID=A0AAD6TES0_9AGAR|nr:hypothetical protein C8F04DRAFT_1075572 [Mycena alexandri]
MAEPTLPESQRAWTFSTWGLPREILTLNSNYVVPPPPAKADLLIRVSHVSLNPGCYVTMATIPPFVRRIISGNTTYVAEGEFAGVIQLAGPAAPPHFKPGARVFGCLPVPKLIGGAGTLAEYFVIPAESVALVPPSISWEVAAGLAGGGQTAINMLLEADLRPGTRVLLNGASGGVGTMALQLAKAKGAFVVATCSTATAELVKSLGADEVVDYRANAPLPAFLAKKYAAQPFEYIFDTIGTQELFTHCPQYLRPDGLLVNVGNFEGPIITVWRAALNTYLPRIFGGVPRRYAMISTTPNGEKAAGLAKMVHEGRLRVVVDEVFDFEDALEAYDRMLARNAKGKIIVKVQDV